MVTEFEPKKIVLYCDKVSGKCLIRVVNSNFETVLQYGTLPPLCSISDLYVDVVKITQVTKEDSKQIYNGKFGFGVNKDGTTTVYDGFGLSTDIVDDANELIRDLFHVR